MQLTKESAAALRVAILLRIDQLRTRAQPGDATDAQNLYEILEQLYQALPL